MDRFATIEEEKIWRYITKQIFHVILFNIEINIDCLNSKLIN